MDSLPQFLLKATWGKPFSGKGFPRERLFRSKSAFTVAVEDDLLSVTETKLAVSDFRDVFVIEGSGDVRFEFADVVFHFFHASAEDIRLRFIGIKRSYSI